MTLPQARKILRDADSAFSDKIEAAAVVCSEGDAKEEDLIACLRIPGLPSEWAAIKLYQQTGRARRGRSARSLVTDPDDWSRFLASASRAR